jgi:hypothetical protein
VEVELLGVTLEGAKSLDRLHYRFEAGASVPCGFNGDAKSTLLQGLESALTGLVGDGRAALGLRSRPASERLDELDWSDPFVEDLADHLMNHIHSHGDPQSLSRTVAPEPVKVIARLSGLLLEVAFAVLPQRQRGPSDEVAAWGTTTGQEDQL